MPSRFEKFSERARRVLTSAQEEAQALNREIETVAVRNLPVFLGTSRCHRENQPKGEEHERNPLHQRVSSSRREESWHDMHSVCKGM